MMAIEDLTNKQLLTEYYCWRAQAVEAEDNPNYSEEEKSYIKERLFMVKQEILKRMAGGK